MYGARPTLRSGLFAFSVLLSSVWGIASCESIVARSGVQCSSTSECRARGGPFATSLCSSEGFCEAIVAAEAGLASGSACSSSDECRLRLGEPARCVESSCQALLSPNATCSLIGAVENDDTVLYGALVPRGGVAGVEYGRASDTLRWLTREWNARAVNERASHIAMVECDESTIDASLAHLLALRPKAIVGPFTNTGLQAYVKNETAAAIPTFAPTVDDPLLVEKPDAKRHVYSCTPNVTRSIKAFQTAANALTDFVLSDRGIATAKVILARTDETTDADVAGRITTGFTLTNGTLSTKVLSTNILQTSPSLLASAQAIALEKPDLVLLSAGIVGEELITNMELRWAALNGNARRPLYLVMGRTANLEESLKSMSDSEVMKGRVWALDWAGTSETDTNYQAAAGAIDANNAKFGPAPARAMDCALASIFGGFAGAATAQATMLSINPQQLMDGVVVATVGDDNSVDLNVENIPKTVGLLGTTPQQKTSLVGVFNPKVRFDANGVLTGTPALYCISSSTAPRARSWTAAGMTFKDSGEADGSIACP